MTECFVIIERESWNKLRGLLAGKMMQCHDCRALRDSLLIMMDMFSLPTVDERLVESVTVSDPLSVRAHSEVLMKDPITRIDGQDGTTIVHETTHKVE